jgi:hypothetical protein
MDEDALDAAREAVAATRLWREQMRHDWGIYHEPEEVLDAAVGELLAERDRLRAVVEAALEVVRSMADSACDADVLRIADLYRILAGHLPAALVVQHSTEARRSLMDERDIETIVFESLGEASACWNPSTGDAVFDSTRAEAIGDRLLAEIRSRITGDRMDELLAERDRLRAVADAAREFDAAWSEWRAKIERGENVNSQDDESQRRAASIAGLIEAVRQLDGSADMGEADT